MILALDIDIEKSSSIVDVYDQIFSLERGEIYNRCYDKEHRTNKTEIKKCIYQISQKTAFWIFENNDDEAFIYQKNFKKICDTVILEAKDKNEDMQSNALIGSYFKVKHCDGEQADEVNFVHQSIYEYFVAVYFFESICNLTSKEEVAGKLGELLKDGHLSKQMLEFIKYKFDSVKEYNLPDITKRIFNIMLRDGMTYHLIEQQKEPILNILVREMNIFSNLLEIIHLWHDKLGCVDKKIDVYLQYNYLNKINDVGTDLSGADLSGADLGGVDLSGACLSGANLGGACLNCWNLEGIDLSGACFREAYLRATYLVGTDLRGADLKKARLSNANLRKANLVGADLFSANLDEADLGRADLRKAWLWRASLREADLSEANLTGANLIGADLREANLRKANLFGANLREADLVGIDLSEANLRGAVFDEKQIDWLCKKYDLGGSKVYLSEKEKIISYKRYCKRKQKERI